MLSFIGSSSKGLCLFLLTNVIFYEKGFQIIVVARDAF